MLRGEVAGVVWVEAVQSRAIAAVGYDSARSTLLVRFVSGDTYVYFDVPEEAPVRFLAADSKGRFFQTEVLGRFRFEKLDEADLSRRPSTASPHRRRRRSGARGKPRPGS